MDIADVAVTSVISAGIAILYTALHDFIKDKTESEERRKALKATLCNSIEQDLTLIEEFAADTATGTELMTRLNDLQWTRYEAEMRSLAPTFDNSSVIRSQLSMFQKREEHVITKCQLPDGKLVVIFDNPPTQTSLSTSPYS